MSYTLNHTNGTLLTTVNDGSIDNTTNLTFVGKNYSGYGAIINQDLVKMLENFAGSVAPSKSLAGEIWYDSGNKKIKFYTGIQHKELSNISIGESQLAQTEVVDGQFHWNTAEQRLYIYDAKSANWRIVGPQFTPSQLDNTVTTFNVADDQDFNHNILAFQSKDVNGNTVYTAIVSPDPEFTLRDPSAFPGFTVIKQGITLNDTDSSGASSTFSVWGTVSNAAKLGGKEVTELVSVTAPVVTGVFTSTNDLGMSINGVTLLKNSSGVTQLINLTNNGSLSVKQLSGSTIYEILSIGFKGDNGRGGIIPSIEQNQTTDLGSSGKHFDRGWINYINATVTTSTNVYAQNIKAISGVTTTIGTEELPFDNIYAQNVHAESGITGPLLANTTAPSSVSSTGVQGEVAFDSSHIYVCIANNTWRRANLTTW